jgi:MinD-like ATPase involved in chromosome partitioning or flagellar assembly
VSEASPPGHSATPKGRIITFYSYKGGTGRSMAVANVAWMLALNGNRVLVIDWDLEAPGIHRYFHPFLEDKELRETSGLIDMVENLAAHAATSSAPLGPDQVDIIDYIEPLEWPRSSAYNLSWKQFGPRARIDFMPAGRQGPAYSRKVSAFNWVDFYERLGGRRLLEAARSQMRGIYDYVLIDSRTGVSDTSGICTVEMPDTLIICFTLNEQSIRGSVGVAESVREHWTRRSDTVPAEAAMPQPVAGGGFRMFFVPTRVEIQSERDKRETALDLAQRTFAPYLDHVPRELRDRYWGSVQMAYFAYYAFEEIPAVFGDKPYEQLSLTTPIKEIVRVITDPPIAELPPLADDPSVAEQIRREIVGWYLRPSLRSRPDAVLLAQDVFDRFDEVQRTAMMRTLLRLVAVAPNAVSSARPATLKELGVLAEMAQTLYDRNLLAASDVQGTRTIALKDPAVIENWEPLRSEIEADRRFLTWRTSLSAAIESWNLSARDESALMRGKLLDEAVSWLGQRRDDLNDVERKYIETSLAHREQLRSADEVARARAVELETLVQKQRMELGANEQPSGNRVRWRWNPLWLLVIGLALAAGYLSYIQFRTTQQLSDEIFSLRSKQSARAVESSVVPTASCPDPAIITRSWMESAGPSTFETNRSLSWPCVLKTARALGRYLDPQLFDSSSTKRNSAVFVTSVLRANGLDVNPLRCDADCLQRGLIGTSAPAPGLVAVLEDGTVGFYVGYEGDILRLVGPDWHLAESPPVARTVFLEVPYDVELQ